MAVIDGFPALYEAALLDGQRAKLGLVAGSGDDAQDRQLAADWLALLEAQAVDFTLGWRRLADAAEGREQALLALFTDTARLQAWLQRWHQRADLPLAQDGMVSEATTQRAAAMRRASPFVIPRNHRVEEALTAATMDDDLQPFQRLLAALQQPFSETPELLPYGQPAPATVTACYQTFCGT